MKHYSLGHEPIRFINWFCLWWDASEFNVLFREVGDLPKGFFLSFFLSWPVDKKLVFIGFYRPNGSLLCVPSKRVQE